jgi:FtsP/CotA-like multicopper oxidase with cupredoxin domain
MKGEIMVRRHWLQAFVVAAVLGLLAAFLTIRRGQTSPGHDVHGFPQPEVRQSSQGVLRTTLHVRIGENQLVDQVSGETRTVHTTTYEGTIPGPTLVVRPGDTLAMDLVNDLPPNPEVQRDKAFPHDPNTTNLHTHGLSVSPLGISDNIFRLMEPGTTSPIKVEIPPDHPSGTYWYHAHKHGSVTYQFFGGMAGFLIVKGGPGTLDALPEIKAAKDLVMGFQVIRTLLNGEVAFVNQDSSQFGTWPPPDDPRFTGDPAQQGPWSTYGIDGQPGLSHLYFTTNGVTNPTLRMRPGEVQRWRWLNAAEGENLLVALQGHGLSVVAMDGITAAEMTSLPAEAPLVLGPGQRYDVLVKAGQPGTYQLQALDPGATSASVSPSGIDPELRASRHVFDAPSPCETQEDLVDNPCAAEDLPSYPLPLATVVVEGDPVDMALPSGPLPVPTGLPSVEKMLSTPPKAVRNVAFENCGKVELEAGMGTVDPMGMPGNGPQGRLPSCGWYFAKYDAAYWGGAPFNSLLLMRDDDDQGVPNPSSDPNMPRVDFKKEGLFTPDQPLFADMIADTYEEWTVVNRSNSDHPFHMHQNPVLVTKINGQTLASPEWHDTLIVPGAVPQVTGPDAPQPNINDVQHGSITFRTYFKPVTAGCFVMHCHILSHEDLGMMQRLDILPGPNQSSQCKPEPMPHMPH